MNNNMNNQNRRPPQREGERRQISRNPAENQKRQTPQGAVDGRDISRNHPQNSRENKGRNKIKIVFFAGVFFVLFVAFATVNIVIGVKEIEVEGNKLCTREEILSIAEISEGSGYFSYNTGKAEKKIKALLPCVENVNISRSFFGKVKVNVTEKEALWYIESYGEYFALSRELVVIKNDESRDRFIECGLVRLDFPELKSAVLQKPIEVKDGDRDCAYIAELLDDVMKTNLYKENRIDQIEIKSKFEIFMVCDLRHKINFGNCFDVEKKLLILEKTLLDSRFDGEDTWDINVSNVGDAAARKNYELDFSYLKSSKS